MMNRDSLLIASLRKSPGRPERGVWEMVMIVVGVAFGAPATRRREPGR